MSCITKTCKPYSTSFKNRRFASDGTKSPTCVPKASIFAPKRSFWRFQTVPNMYVSWHIIWSLHFRDFGCRLGSQFGPLLACMSRDPAAQNWFFSGLGTVRVIFCPQVVSGAAFGRYLEPLLSILRCLLWMLLASVRQEHIVPAVILPTVLLFACAICVHWKERKWTTFEYRSAT